MRAAPLLALVLLAGCGGQPAAERPPPEQHFAVATERPRPAQPQGRWPTARVLRRTALRAAPGWRAVGRLRPRTEFGSPKVVSVLRRRGGWLRVVVPERANGRPAWIRAAATRPGAVDVSLHVDRSARRLTVRRGSRVLRRVAIAVGRPGTETPRGRFAVTDKLRGADFGDYYGCCILAISGRQTNLPPRWRGGNLLAIHGGPTWAIGGELSAGCLHAGETDLRWLMRRIPLGTPITIHP